MTILNGLEIKNMPTVETLIKKLDEKKQLIDFPPIYKKKIWKHMQEKYPNETIQIGNIGDCGYCAFIGNNSFIIPVKDYDPYVAV